MDLALADEVPNRRCGDHHLGRTHAPLAVPRLQELLGEGQITLLGDEVGVCARVDEQIEYKPATHLGNATVRGRRAIAGGAARLKRQENE